MPRPRIVKETKHQIEERAPPDSNSVKAHEWLSGDSRSTFGVAVDTGRPFGLYLSTKAERKIRLHAMKEAPRRLEVMGFLLGEVRSWRGSTYVIVKDVGTTELKSSSSKVRFAPEAFPKLFHELDDSGFDYILVGWYHSHPGHTCFLSRTDLDTQRSMFNESFHTALVIDPINKDIKTFRLAGDSYEEIPFALYDPRDKSIQKNGRKRRLKVKPVTTT